jgi:hypothetical protein
MSLHDFLDEERELEWFYSKNKINNKAKVGYRRVSGKIGLTDKENGIRGAWVEKRVALFKMLLNYGYQIIPFSEATDSTKADGFKTFDKYQHCDVLILEFGGTNLQFYQKYWDDTCEMIKQHQGRIIFINDDPDLSFLWDLLPDESWSRWTIAANATETVAVSEALKAPEDVRVVDYPMSRGMEFAEFSSGGIDKLVYIGRPNGRAKYFKEYTKSAALEVAGKPAEWEDYTQLSIVENPQQRDRRAFYRKYNGCLAIYDDKHKRCGWRTGRAYHALYAGIPVFAPAGNKGLAWCYAVDSAEDVTKAASMSVEKRNKLWLMQKDYVEKKDAMTDLISL